MSFTPTAMMTLLISIHGISVTSTKEELECLMCVPDKPTPIMVGKKKLCFNFPNTIQRKCNDDDMWRKNGYCRQTCAYAGRHYQDENCCNIDIANESIQIEEREARALGANEEHAPKEYPVKDDNASDQDQELPLIYGEFPSSRTAIKDSPSENPILPIANYCEQCTDLPHPNMEKNNTVCAQYVLQLIPQECNKSSNWEDNDWCQYTCFKEGYGYQHDNCCLNEIIPSAVPDGGFEDYVEITRDTGPVPLVVVVLFGILSQFVILPLLVRSRRYKRNQGNNMLLLEQTGEMDEHVLEGTIGPATTIQAQPPSSDDGTEKNAKNKPEGIPGQLLGLTGRAVIAAAKEGKENALPRHTNSDEEKSSDDQVQDDIKMISSSPVSRVLTTENATIFDANLTHRHRRRHPTTELRIVEEARMSTIRHEEEQCGLTPHNYTPPDDIILSNKKMTMYQSFLNFLSNAFCLCHFDNETKRILRLSIPFTISQLVETICDAIIIGIVSMQLGTEALSAFVVFETFVEITTQFAGGVVDAQVSLTGHAHGAGNNLLAGQYVQLCSMMYLVFQLPFIFLWSFATRDIMLWMGFSYTVSQMAQSYGRLAVWRDVIVGVSDCLYNIFEVADKEVAVTIIIITEALVKLAATAIPLLFFNGNLDTVGAVAIANAFIFYVFTIVFTFSKGWMKPFAKGIFGSFASKDRLAVRQVFKTAAPLAFGSVLVHGEWELLTVFAAFLGPAEVTAWAIMGSLWDIFESTSEAIGDAAEVRVAYHCGKRRPDQARISAHKSIFIGITFSIVTTFIILPLGNLIPRWLTSDPTLQKMVRENIPLICVSNIFLTVGNVCWAEIGAQGRYKLATIIICGSSWFVSIPFAAISVFVLVLDLRSMTASVCIGFQCASTALAFVLLQSDWKRLAQKVSDTNAVTGQISSSDDEQSSVPSSSSSSSDSNSSSSGINVLRC